MKIFAVVVLVLATFDVLESAQLSDGDLADTVQIIIDDVLSGIPNSLSLKDVRVEIPENNIERGSSVINEVSISGLKKLNTKLNYDEESSRLDFTQDFSELALVVDYTVNLEGLVNLYHHLSVHVDLFDLKVDGFAVVTADGKNVENLNLLITLGKSKVDIKGLLNSDELSQEISTFLSENVAAVLDAIDPILAPYFNFIVKEIINTALKMNN